MISNTQNSNLTTARLCLRPLSPTDLKAFQSLHANAEVTRYLAPARPLTNPESFRLLAQVLGHWQLRDYGYWAVSLNASAVGNTPIDEPPRDVDPLSTATPEEGLTHGGPFIGVVGLWFPEGWPGVELGWRFMPEFWGSGYAREASSALLDYAFERLGLPEVLSIIRADNQRSVRLAEHLGMNCYGTRTITDVEVVTYGLSRN